MADIHKEAFVAGNLAMFSSAKYSDLTIRCGPDEYKLHRVIICARSQFFAKACDGQFLEAKTATIDLTDDDPQTVKRMLTYLYTLEYDDGQCRSEEIEGAQKRGQGHSSAASLPVLGQSLSATVEDSSSPENSIPTTPSPPLLVSPEDVIPEELRKIPGERMMGNVLVYALADKYNIPELKILAKAKFATLVEGYASLEDISTIASAVFTTTPSSDSGLREIVIKACSNRVENALMNETIVSTMEQQGPFALGVLNQIVGRLANAEVRLEETLIREDVLRADLANSEKEKKELTQQAEDARHENAAWHSRLDDVLASANQIDKCRRCQVNFSSHLKRIEPSAIPALQLTCAKCRTKHSLRRCDQDNCSPQ